MIRTTRHTATFANTGKLSSLDKFLTEYARVTQYYMDYLWTTPINTTYTNKMEYTRKTI